MATTRLVLCKVFKEGDNVVPQQEALTEKDIQTLVGEGYQLMNAEETCHDLRKAIEESYRLANTVLHTRKSVGGRSYFWIFLQDKNALQFERLKDESGNDLCEVCIIKVTAPAPAPAPVARNPFWNLITAERIRDNGIPAINELKAFMLHAPSQAFPISGRRYEELKNYLFAVEDFLECNPEHGVCWDLEDRLQVVLKPEPTGTTESSYIPFWDSLITGPISLFCLETLFVDRDTSRFSSTEEIRPDKLGRFLRLALWRGEEKGPETDGDPKQELRSKLVWTYGTLPYVLAYYTRSEEVTYCALRYNSELGRVEVIDMLSLNLSLPQDRLKAFLIGFNISKLLVPLSEYAKMINAESDFEDILTDEKTILLGTAVDKIYKRQETFNRVRSLYADIKSCPNAEQVTRANDKARRLRMVPRCLRNWKARPESELLRALIDVAEALVWLHDRNLTHRDITWRNVLRNCKGPNWVVIDFDEATRSPCHQAHRLCADAHAPEMCKGSHDKSVDIWAIGHLIKSGKVKPLSKGLQELMVECLQEAQQRPSAAQCLEKLQACRNAVADTPHTGTEI